MAITAIPMTGNTSSASTAGSATIAASSGGFAELLFGQIDSRLLTGDLQAGQKDAPETEKPLPQDTAEADPALAFLLGNPAIQPDLREVRQNTITDTKNPSGSNPLADIRQGNDEKTTLFQALTAPARPTTVPDAPETLPTQPESSNTRFSVLPERTAGTPDMRLPAPTAQTATTSHTSLPTASTWNAPASVSTSIPTALTEPPAATANIAADTIAAPDTTAMLSSQTPPAVERANANVKLEIPAPLHSNNWSQDLGNKVVWLARNDQQQAQININPPQLGPIQITLHLNGDQASAVFASPHAEVRQAIESSLPHLREMLSSAGVNLGQTDVGANMAQQNREMPFQASNGTRRADENAILPDIESAGKNSLGTPIQRGKGLVDLFA